MSWEPSEQRRIDERCYGDCGRILRVLVGLTDDGRREVFEAVHDLVLSFRFHVVQPGDYQHVHGSSFMSVVNPPGKLEDGNCGAGDGAVVDVTGVPSYSPYIQYSWRMELETQILMRSVLLAAWRFPGTPPSSQLGQK